MLEELRKAPRRTVGTKQTARAVEKGEAVAVFVARDAEPHVVRQLVSQCRQKGIQVHEIDTMRELGLSCGVKVGAASAAILGPRTGPWGAANR